MDFQAIMRHGLRNVLNFSGRDDRQQFLIYFLVTFVSILAIGLLFFLEDAIRSMQTLGMIVDDGQREWESYSDYSDRKRTANMEATIDVGKFVFVGIVLPFLLTLSSMVRRIHDFGLSGKWLLAVIPASLFFPFMPIVAIVVLAIMKSESGENAYGISITPSSTDSV